MKKRNNHNLLRFRAADDPKKDGRIFRDAEIVAETRKSDDGTTAVVVRATVSSETPYPRMFWDKENKAWVRGNEILGHKPEEIDDSRMRDGLVIQDTHYGDQIGIIRHPEIKDGKLGGEIEFGCGARAQEIAKDAAAGIRRNMSVGYIVNEYEKVGKDENGVPNFRVTKWTPYEASFVNCPADTNIGVGRSDDPVPDGHRAAEETTGTPTAANIAAERKDTMKYTAEQRQKIRELASAAHVSGEEVADILTSEREFEEVREELLNRREKYLAELAQKPAKPVEEAQRAAKLDEGTQKEIRKKYDFVKVLRYYAEMSESKSSRIDIGFEREISDEIARQTGRAVQGIILPDSIRSTEGQETLGTPAHGVTDGLGGAGSNTIATNLLAGRFIDALTDALVLRSELGAEVLPGLVGNVAIPKGGSISGGWIGEGANAPKKNPTFGQITATPHTYGAYVDITRKLLLQSSIAVQAKVLEWLMYACAKGLEDGAFTGSGTDAAPTGLVTALSGTAWGNAPTFDKIVDLIAAVKIANSYKPSMKFVGDTNVWAKLAKTRDYEVLQNAAGTENVGAIGGAVRVLDATTNKVLGRDFVESHCMAAKKLIFGDFTQLALCLWSGTDIIVDPYANSTSGGLRIVALQDSDVLIKRPEAFAMATGVHA